MIQDSDPLPYTKVDRAVKAKAVLLAGQMGVTYQHAIGSLVEWWSLHSEPRDLAKIIDSGGPLQVSVSKEEAETTFLLASGKRVDAEILIRLGFLDNLENGQFRVKGMSRYFDPVSRRNRSISAAQKAGKASVESRKKTTGTAQPHKTSRSGTRSEDVRTTPERLSNDSRTTLEHTLEPTLERPSNTEDRGQRTEDSSLSLFLSEREALPASKPKQKPKRERQKSRWESLWAGMCEDREVADGPNEKELLENQILEPGTINRLLQKAAEHVQTLEPEPQSDENLDAHLICLWRIYLHSAYWRTASPPFPLEGFATFKTLERCNALFGTDKDPTVTLKRWS